MVVMLGATWIGALITATLLAGHTAPLEEKKKSAEQEAQTLQAKLTSLTERSKNKKPSKAIEDEIARLESVLRFKRELLISVETGGLGSSDGFSHYLSALARQRLEGVWLTDFAINSIDNKLAIKGRAVKPELVPAYIKLLGREETLRGRTFAELKAKVIERGSSLGAGAQAESKSASEPERYIEFSLSSAPSTAREGAPR